MNKKNVLVILTDQLRKDSLSCYNNRRNCATPNIEWLAEHGTRFNKCYVANPICMPNRLSIFTGTYPRNHGLWTNGVLINEKRTIVDEFSDYGYNTASIGKIHFEPYGASDNSGSRESRYYWKNMNTEYQWGGPYWGFQHVELTIGHTLPLAHYGKWFYNKGGKDNMLNSNNDGTRPIPKELHDSAFVSERTINYIKNVRDKNKPFFVVASFPDPHHPFNPPEECSKKYTKKDAISPIGDYNDLKTRPSHYMKHYKGGWHRKGNIVEQHINGVSKDDENTRIINTYAMVDLIDENIGKILDTLRTEELIDDTIIVFTSDHGELLGDHGLWYKGPFYYEGLINVPLIIYGLNEKEKETNALISSIDILPTVCEAVGIKVPEYVNGYSQLFVIDDNRDNTKIRDSCLIEYRNGYGDNDISSKVLITDKYKYIYYETGESELTDLENDIYESLNVINDVKYSSIKNKMQKQLLTEILSTETKINKQLSHA